MGMHIPTSSFVSKVNKDAMLLTRVMATFHNMQQAAVQSWKQNAATALEPVLMLLKKMQ
jgi:hypothetical protein